MSQLEWQKVKEVLYGALSTPPATREEFLDSACGDDGELRTRVEVLLGSYESEFMESPLLAHEDVKRVRSEPLLEPGRKFSHYTILKLLGRGGMGEVYLANDENLDRLAAIKIIHGDSGFGDQSAARLIREARSVAKLDHPNICSVYEVGETYGQPFIAMQYVEGEMLDTLIQAGSVSFSDAIAYARQIAAALAKAHAWGIIHRDIKPSNIIVDRRKQVKVLDFGLAKEIWVDPETTDISAVGLIAGTLTYMSPEHARGQDIDGRTDIWSLGVVLYQMLTGKLPFCGETKADVISSILNSDFNPPTSVSKAMPPATDYVISRALQKDLLKRYATAEEFDSDLTDLAETGTVEVRAGFDQTPGISASSLPSLYRFGRVAVPLIMIAALAIVGLGVWQTRNAASVAPPFMANIADMQVSSLYDLKRQAGGAITGLSFSPDGNAVAFALSGEKGTSVYVQQLSSEEPLRITDETVTASSPVWSPDGNRVAYLSASGDGVSIWGSSLTGEEKVPLAGLEGRLLDYELNKWSNDGTSVFLTVRRRPSYIDLETGKITPLDVTGIDGNILGGVRVSPDETQFFVNTIQDDAEQLWLKSIDTLDARRVAGPAAGIGAASWFPDNQAYAYTADHNGRLQIFVGNVNGPSSRPVTFGNFNSNLPVVSADGRKIAYISNKDEANIFSIDVASGRETPLTAEVDMHLFPAIASDGDTVVYQTFNDGTKLEAGRIRIKGRTLPAPVRGSRPTWSPDGTQIAFTRGHHAAAPNLFTIGLSGEPEHQITTAGITGVAYTIAPFDYDGSPFSWSPDSAKLAFVSASSGKSNIWTAARDGANEMILTNLEDTAKKVASPMWSPDGQRLAFIHGTAPKPGGFPLQNSIMVHSGGKAVSVAAFRLPVSLLGWSAGTNGLYVAVADYASLPPEGDTDIYFVSADGSDRVRKVSRLPNARRFGIRISPDQKWIAFTQRRDDIDDLYIVPMGSSEPRRITSNDDSTVFYSGVTWSPDSRTLLYSKQTGGMQISLISHTQQEEK